MPTMGLAMACLVTVNHLGWNTEGACTFQRQQQPLKAAREGKQQVGVNTGLLAAKSNCAGYGGAGKAGRRDTEVTQLRSLLFQWKESKA